MLKNKDLFDFVQGKLDSLTEDWYQSLNKDREGVYGSDNPEAIKKLKKQNKAFHVQFSKLFDSNCTTYLEDFHGWIEEISTDNAHQATPLEEILEEFFRVEKQYMKLIEEYVLSKAESVPAMRVLTWTQGVTDTINQIILEFTIQHSKVAEKRLTAQQEMIIEMSAPVIALTESTGLLPLIGEINTYRAQIIFEKTLMQCAERKFDRLFIDLSGVPIIDTMVAHQIFQLISGLKLLGVHTSLSGMSPEIAQTSIALGLDFKDIAVHSSLSKAMKKYQI